MTHVPHESSLYPAHTILLRKCANVLQQQENKTNDLSGSLISFSLEAALINLPKGC